MVSRAVKLNPEDVDSLVMLAKLQLRSSQYSQATTTAAKVHSLPHLGFAIVHIIAAKAYYAEKLNKGAISELQQFLRESPAGPMAALARKSLVHLGAKP